jgi:thiol-disulfide isomerase/thioredoxin
MTIIRHPNPVLAALLAGALGATLLALGGCSSDDGVRGGAADLPGPVPSGVEFHADSEAPMDAPKIIGSLMDGQAIDGNDFLAGRPAVVQFFTSWCDLCAAAQPDLAQVAADYGDALTLVYVDAPDSDPREDVEKYIQDYDIRAPVVLDKDGKTWRAYAVSEPPSTGVIDSDGKLVKLWAGGTTAETLRETLDKLITLPSEGN